MWNFVFYLTNKPALTMLEWDPTCKTNKKTHVDQGESVAAILGRIAPLWFVESP
jgi:hypothetical protein